MQTYLTDCIALESSGHRSGLFERKLCQWLMLEIVFYRSSCVKKWSVSNHHFKKGILSLSFLKQVFRGIYMVHLLHRDPLSDVGDSSDASNCTCTKKHASNIYNKMPIFGGKNCIALHIALQKTYERYSK